MGEHTYLKDPSYIPFFASCEKLSQGCYGWKARIYMLVNLDLNSSSVINLTTEVHLGHMKLH
jgi:hypothetical protein